MSAIYGTVRRLGESFTREDGTTKFKASIKGTTNMSQNLAIRAHYYDGICETCIDVGEYITRDINGATFLVETIRPQPRDMKIVQIFTAECNMLVTTAREIPVADGSNQRKEFEILNEKIPAFYTISIRALVPNQEGYQNRNITLVHTSARYDIQALDRVYLNIDDIPLEACPKYRLDTIDLSLLDPSHPVDITGVVVFQLSEDPRPWGIKDESGAEEPPDEPPPGGGLWD